MSKSRKKRIKIMQDGKPRKDHKVELFEREFNLVQDAIYYALEIAGKPISEDDLESVVAKEGKIPGEGELTYWTERISLGGGKWVIKVSTWIPKVLLQDQARGR